MSSHIFFTPEMEIIWNTQDYCTTCYYNNDQERDVVETSKMRNERL